MSRWITVITFSSVGNLQVVFFYCFIFYSSIHFLLKLCVSELIRCWIKELSNRNVQNFLVFLPQMGQLAALFTILFLNVIFWGFFQFNGAQDLSECSLQPSVALSSFPRPVLTEVKKLPSSSTVWSKQTTDAAAAARNVARITSCAVFPANTHLAPGVRSN